jgi:hypothetical protein
MEFGVKGNETGEPTVKAEVVEDRVMETTVVIQAAVVVLHPVELTYAVGLAGLEVLVTVKLIAVLG